MCRLSLDVMLSQRYPPWFVAQYIVVLVQWVVQLSILSIGYAVTNCSISPLCFPYHSTTQFLLKWLLLYFGPNI